FFVLQGGSIRYKVGLVVFSIGPVLYHVIIVFAAGVARLATGINNPGFHAAFIYYHPPRRAILWPGSINNTNSAAGIYFAAKGINNRKQVRNSGGLIMPPVIVFYLFPGVAFIVSIRLGYFGKLIGAYGILQSFEGLQDN